MRRITIVAALMFVTPVQSGTVMSIGYASTEHDGEELSLGYSWQTDSYEVMINYLSGVLYSEKSSRYREEVVSGGNTLCRDTTNGQFAESEKCKPTDFFYAPTIEGRYFVSQNDSIGLGFIGGSSSAMYAAYMRHIGNTTYFQLRAGNGYASVGYGFRF